MEIFANRFLALLSVLLVAGVASAAQSPDATIEFKAGAIGQNNITNHPYAGADNGLDWLNGVTGRNFVGPKAGQVLKRITADRPIRGAKESQIYKRAARSVVLILTKDSLGTGTLISSDGDIITNYHVVKGLLDVGVVFKPITDDLKVGDADLLRARVIKFDEVADLALIRVDRVPAGILPIVIGTKAEVSIGDDVHAIGHPTGESWTYTKGVISQIRSAYEWTSEQNGPTHIADVIQTQTPINPGNSGGPLLSDSGKLAGINSFKAKGEGMNFAVSSAEVRRFLATTGNRMASASNSANKVADAKDNECKAKEIYRGDSKDGKQLVIGYDTDCDGKANAELWTPYDIREPILLQIDENKDGFFDTIIFDFDRKGKWSYSLVDTDFDRQWDVECDHADGGLAATSCVPYKPVKK